MGQLYGEYDLNTREWWVNFQRNLKPNLRAVLHRNRSLFYFRKATDTWSEVKNSFSLPMYDVPFHLLLVVIVNIFMVFVYTNKLSRSENIFKQTYIFIRQKIVYKILVENRREGARRNTFTKLAFSCKTIIFDTRCENKKVQVVWTKNWLLFGNTEKQIECLYWLCFRFSFFFFFTYRFYPSNGFRRDIQ